MAHYAVINPLTMRVSQVFVGRDESDLADGVNDWETYYAPEGMIVKRTSYNTYGGVHYTDGEPSADQSKALRFNYAGIGYTFDETIGTDGAFIPPKPFDSWVLDEATCLWAAPVEYPTDGLVYSWDEDTLSWVEVPGEAL